MLAGNLPLLNPFRYGLFAWQLASHKLCRWLVPVALVIALVTNAVLAAHSPWYRGHAGCPARFLRCGRRRLGRQPTLRIPFYFFVANFAILMAWFRYARGERMTTWSPSKRPSALPQICAR